MTEHHEQLILKYLQGTISASEQQELNAWMQASDENKKLVNDFVWMWKAGKSRIDTPDFHTSAEWHRIEKAIGQGQTKQAQSIQFFGYATPLKIAASIAVIAVFSWIIYSVVFRHETTLKQSGEEMVAVTLPDGSTAWLNHHSRLAYPDNFSKRSRTVLLSGEAFFEVKPDSEKPFIVQTKKARVKVVGTSFNVRAFEETAETEVFVVTGRVNFSNRRDKQGITLRPGEMAVTENNTIVRLGNEELNTLAWKEKRLIFKKSSLSRVVNNLETYFKIDIEIKNENVAGCRFTGTFDQPTLEEVIEALSISLDLTIVKKGDIYVVDGDGC